MDHPVKIITRGLLVEVAPENFIDDTLRTVQLFRRAKGEVL
jgi:hypothetical protein